ncbi:lantibiotic dehydratase C-terminal domain-containing protein [Chryseobacterium sp. MYb264]|uniref:lantibiotic dehydratase C-terminal domain-containing protein n=1 Tax=Chryseobacterium sp. MYb264 TaxID=2745153 RepID=UPI002E0E0056|nr:lantibiotic dehydratase C-terminal domain-containing protein [Chryseobacterium sp. MYb264]
MKSRFSIQETIKKNKIGERKKIIQSLFHMHINRLFVSDQRLFEMIIYDYLHRYYKTIFFKNMQKENI